MAGGVAEADTDTGYDEARRMLDLCASVGGREVDVSWTNGAGIPRIPRTLRKALLSLGGPLPKPKNPDWLNSVFIEAISIEDMIRTMPAMMRAANTERLNFIVRPHGAGVTFLQLDDLDAVKLARAAPPCFIALETSPGNYQAWLAIPDLLDQDFARRVRKGSGADAGASGATRIAGSRNLKPKYAPNFPRVVIHTAQPGRKTDYAELEQLGLVAPPEEFAPLPAAPARSISGSNRKWPSYPMCVEGAPPNQAGTGPDLSLADWTWCMTASTWGFGETEMAEMLLVVSEHPRHPSNGARSAERTARRAAAAVERRRQQRQHRPNEYGQR